VVLHSTSSYLKDVVEQLLACVNAGCCVISTCEELAYPFRKSPPLADKLDKAAKHEGVALVGTGVNPGFVMDKLVLTLAAISQRVDSVKVQRIVDASRRREPLQRKIGAGMSVEEFAEKTAAGVIKHHGLPESVAMVADGLGIPVDTITETIEPVIAQENITTEFLEVAAGRAAGVHQIARGFSLGREKIVLELKMYVGAKDPADTIELTGEPNISMIIPGGTHGDIATAAVVVNAIPLIVAAPAGLVTSRDLAAELFLVGNIPGLKRQFGRVQIGPGWRFLDRRTLALSLLESARCDRIAKIAFDSALLGGCCTDRRRPVGARSAEGWARASGVAERALAIRPRNYPLRPTKIYGLV
jgi:hypothetical protein